MQFEGEVLALGLAPLGVVRAIYPLNASSAMKTPPLQFDYFSDPLYGNLTKRVSKACQHSSSCTD